MLTMTSEGKTNFIWVIVKEHIRDRTCPIFGENKGQVTLGQAMSQYHAAVPYKNQV